MRCAYPNCFHPALYVPVIELPTVRTGGETTQMVQTPEPTRLLFKEVCEKHKESYNLTDWMRPVDWTYIREAARAYGFTVPQPDLIAVRFKPLGWNPKRTLELER